MHYKDKICIVTGAASGIGNGVSQRLIKEGAVVVFADINNEALENVLSGLPRERAVKCLVDVTKEDDIKKLINQTYERFKRIDYMFNNAGIGCTMPIEKVSLEIWKKVIDVDLWSVIYAVHHLIPIMKKQKGGHIINTSSVAGIMSFPYQAPYTAAKFGITGMSECLRYELAFDNIKVSTICPAEVATSIYKIFKDGKEIKSAPPKNAITVEKAVDYIFEGLDKEKPIIVIPPEAEEFYLQMQTHKDRYDKYCFDMADTRRKNIEETGFYY